MKNSFDALIRDLLTKKELKVLYKRFQIIEWLKTKLTYREIARRMAISTTTVVRLNKRLKIRLKHRKKLTYLRAAAHELVNKNKKLPWKFG